MKLLAQIASGICILMNCAFASPTIPRSMEEIDVYVEEAAGYFHSRIDAIRKLSKEEMTFDNTFRAWIDLRNELLVKSSVLLFAGGDGELAQAVSEKAFNLGLNFVDAMLKDVRLLQALLTYVDKVLSETISLSPYEWQIIDSFLQDCEEKRGELSGLRKQVQQHPMTPYLYKRGICAEKNDVERCLTVLNLNTNMQKEEQCYLFGGIRPWQERVEGIVEKLLILGADVICLQEVHEEAANLALYEGLKNHYAHFYMAIGPRSCGLGIDTLGLPSGLFVASKYPIENPTLTLFSQVGLQMNFAVFDFVVKNGRETLGHLYTTHMQSLDFEEFDQIRAAELIEIVSKMQRDLQENEEIPLFLCGDLNIPWGSQEPGEEIIRTYFYDAYNRERISVSAENRTCINLAPTGEKNAQILDYALLFGDSDYMIDTELVPMNDVAQPMQALSDHHGLITRIRKASL